MDVKELLSPWTQSVKETSRGFDISLRHDDLLSVINALHKIRWGYLAAITGLDLGTEKGQIELLYHFCSGAAVLTLRILVQREAPSIPTISHIIPSASFLERELAEMFGVAIVGSSTPAHLFLPDDWPEHVYPLRKDAAVEETA